MRQPRISIIAATSENRIIGRDNKLPWNIPEDLKRFRKLTTGHAVIMGRKTFQSIGRPLPNRMNFVVTSDLTFKAKDITVCHSLDVALEKAKVIEKEEIFIIGGGQIYSQALPFADKLYLTVIKGNFEGDTYFPDFTEFKKEVFREEKKSDDFKFTFLELERI